MKRLVFAIFVESILLKETIIDMIVAGIDYSLSCPAMCVYDSSKGKFNFKNSYFYFRSNLARCEVLKKEIFVVKTISHIIVIWIDMMILAIGH